MGYVVAAYAVVIGSVLAYAIWVERERRRAGRALEALAKEPGAAGPRE